ncbi:hypothetical protein [Halobacillus sp. A5]|uniref:hypothetical protein n=1 Tax=Halobacillus sp. A5 TaxID=2880263 RepID=UPI0020A65BC3|nr:hypothetical protein [Halobacillus sp. A5]MCP3028717.1 hypothetical protein [Halobacillus sp. A5]
MRISLKRTTKTLFLLVLALGFIGVNSVSAAPSLHDKKTITTYISAEEIQSKLDTEKKATSLIEPFSIFASGAVGTKAKNALQGGAYAVSVYGLGTGITELAEKDMAEFERQLNTIEKNNAKGIYIKQPYYFGYIDKGEKGWLPNGSPTAMGTY